MKTRRNISVLPDDILLLIMSYVEVKDILVLRKVGPHPPQAPRATHPNHITPRTDVPPPARHEQIALGVVRRHETPRRAKGPSHPRRVCGGPQGTRCGAPGGACRARRQVRRQLELATSRRAEGNRVLCAHIRGRQSPGGHPDLSLARRVPARAEREVPDHRRGARVDVLGGPAWGVGGVSRRRVDRGEDD